LTAVKKHFNPEIWAVHIMISEESELASTNCKISEENSCTKPARKRHGANNQYRHKFFIKWIAKTFPQSVKNAKDDTELGSTAPGNILLDVAGGKGELSARLSLCLCLKVIMIDPRTANIYDCFQKHVFNSLPKKWQERMSSQDPDRIKSIIKHRFHQFEQYFPSDGNDVIAELNRDERLLDAVQRSTLIIGMHADGATEAIVDIALHYRKPFIVVPCCVFPNFFRHRCIPSDDDPEKMVPVRNHEQFCKYLSLKDSHFIVETLPFEGRNIGIWWDGKVRDGDEE
jgi:hypothetical protein